MAEMRARAAKELETYNGLKTANPLTDVYGIVSVPTSHCFRINLIDATDAHGFAGISVSHPPGLDLDTIEIALVGADGRLVYIDRLGMYDVYRFSSLGELVDGLVRLANNLPVDDDDDDEE